MDRFIQKEDLGEFFAKMYEANRGKDIEVTLRVSEEKIEVYKRADAHFEHINIIEANPTIESIVESISKTTL